MSTLVVLVDRPEDLPIPPEGLQVMRTRDYLTNPNTFGDATPRIVNLSSSAHGISDVDLENPNFEHTEYDAWSSYGRSKSENALPSGKVVASQNASV